MTRHARVAATLLLAALALAALVLPAAAPAKGAPKGFFGVVTQEELSGQDYQHLAEGESARSA